MPATKRKSNLSYAARAKRARAFNAPASQRARLADRRRPLVLTKLVSQVNRLTRTIETKQAQWASLTNVGLPHNNTYTVLQAGGIQLNPLRTVTGTDDPMTGNSGSRIGDKITVKGMAICGMVELPARRSKTHIRIMVVKCPRGQEPSRANALFQGNCTNKMLDTVNTEKFTILWQTRFNLSPSNVGFTGIAPNVDGTPSGGMPAGIATRLFKGWIPGKRFGKGGVVTYEDASSINPKFFDYRVVILAYDWFGTPQDINNVALLNEMYTKIYFKDA